MSQILFPEWRAQNQSTTYPFVADAELTNGVVFIPDGLFIDAVLYPIGATENLRISHIDVSHENITIWIGDDVSVNQASGSFSVPVTSGEITLLDTYGRPAGLIVADPVQLSLFSAWGIGSQVFTASQTGFVPTVCVPTFETGVRGILLDDGTFLTGEVWIVGGDGVVLRHQNLTAPSTTGSDAPVDVVRIDIVGDPLFRRKLCGIQTSFTTPAFIKTITFNDGIQQLAIPPDTYGDIQMTANNDLSADTVLRIRATTDGVVVEAVGSAI